LLFVLLKCKAEGLMDAVASTAPLASENATLMGLLQALKVNYPKRFCVLSEIILVLIITLFFIITIITVIIYCYYSGSNTVVCCRLSVSSHDCGYCG
jgi:hypothetical protein